MLMDRLKNPDLPFLALFDPTFFRIAPPLYSGGFGQKFIAGTRRFVKLTR